MLVMPYTYPCGTAMNQVCLQGAQLESGALVTSQLSQNMHPLSLRSRFETVTERPTVVAAVNERIRIHVEQRSRVFSWLSTFDM